VLSSGERRSSVFFPRRVALKDANAPDRNSPDNEKRVNGQRPRGDQGVIQKTKMRADIAKGIFTIALQAYKLRAGRRTAISNIVVWVGSFPVRVSQNTVDFSRQQSPRN